MQLEKNRIKDVVETALKNINEMIDVSTVIGKPFVTVDGEYIFPVSKVTVGVLAGGGEYGSVSVLKKAEEMPFSAGNGSIVSITPCGFLIKDNKGEYSMVNVSNNSFEKIFDRATDFVTGLVKGDSGV